MRITSLAVAVSSIVAIFAVNFIGSTPKAESSQPPTPVVSEQIPTEVAVPSMFPGNPIEFFDDFSWRSFLALNWPAKNPTTTRGDADTTKDLSNTHAGVRRVWETWKADYELFQNNGLEPSKWDSFDALTPCPDVSHTGGGKVRLLGTFTPFGEFNQAGAALGSAGSPLVAQNKTYTRYEIRVNKPEYEFIVNEKLYLEKNLPENRVPPGGPLSFTNGSIEVKAAWKELATDAEKMTAVGKYYTITAKVPPPPGSGMASPTKTFALVGFHIAQKTPKMPQWVWSSFEHIDNVPDFGVTPTAGESFSFNDPIKPQKIAPIPPPKQLSLANPPTSPATPEMQVVRGRRLHDKTKEANTRYRTHSKVAGTIWENYLLVMTQWPTNIAVPDGSPFPPNANDTCVANSVMETYFQKTQSCMRCHDDARDRKTDFVWFVHLRAFSENPGLRTKRLGEIMDRIERRQPPELQDKQRMLPDR